MIKAWKDFSLNCEKVYVTSLKAASRYFGKDVNFFEISYEDFSVFKNKYPPQATALKRFLSYCLEGIRNEELRSYVSTPGHALSNMAKQSFDWNRSKSKQIAEKYISSIQDTKKQAMNRYCLKLLDKVLTSSDYDLVTVNEVDIANAARKISQGVENFPKNGSINRIAKEFYTWRESLVQHQTPASQSSVSHGESSGNRGAQVMEIESDSSANTLAEQCIEDFKIVRQARVAEEERNGWRNLNAQQRELIVRKYQTQPNVREALGRIYSVARGSYAQKVGEIIRERARLPAENKAHVSQIVLNDWIQKEKYVLAKPRQGQSMVSR